MAGLDWHGDEVAATIRAEIARRLKAATILVANRARVLLSVAGTGKSGGGRDAKGKFLKQRTVYGANPSRPGEPPHKQTGHLRRSVDSEVDEATLTGRVGTNLNYGRWLELGTRKMAARPWLRRALAETQDQVVRLLSAPMK